jgi:hypothetical protein
LRHQARHHRRDDVLDVHLKRELQIGQRAGDGDVFHRCRPIVVSRLDLRLIEHGVGEEIAEGRIGREVGQRRALVVGPVRRLHRPNLVAGFALAVRGEAFAAGQRQRCQSNDNE